MLIREMTASLLADISAEIRTADSLLDIAKECRLGSFDMIILLDITPLFDGSASIASIRPNGLHRPELFVLAWQHSEHTVLSLLESGVSQYITFPINIRRIKRKICETLQE